jgi:hypothetical protein
VLLRTDHDHIYAIESIFLILCLGRQLCWYKIPASKMHNNIQPSAKKNGLTKMENESRKIDTWESGKF